MKHLLLLAFSALSITMQAQIPGMSGVTIQNPNDSTIRVFYTNKIKPATQPAFYLNGKFINVSLQYLNSAQIENITVIKETDTINGTVYNGKVFVTTKENYIPTLITLSDLKFKYTNIADKPRRVRDGVCIRNSVQGAHL